MGRNKKHFGERRILVMNELIAGNVCSLLGMGADVTSASRRTARGVLWFQTLGQVFFGLSSVFLKGYSAAVQSGVSVVRNLVAMQGIKNKGIEWFFVGAAVVLGIWWNNRGLAGWLPVIANFEYSLAVFRFHDDERSLKKAFLVMVAMFAIFNFVIRNYVGILSNTAVFLSVVMSLWKSRR